MLCRSADWDALSRVPLERRRSPGGNETESLPSQNVLRLSPNEVEALPSLQPPQEGSDRVSDRDRKSRVDRLRARYSSTRTQNRDRVLSPDPAIAARTGA